MLILKIAFRNIFRNTRRSLTTLFTIAIGAAAVLVFGVLPPSNVVKRPKSWRSQPTVHLRYSETRLRSCRLKQRRFPNRRSPVTSFALRSILPAWRVSEPSVRISTPGVDGQNCNSTAAIPGGLPDVASSGHDIGSCGKDTPNLAGSSDSTVR